MLCVLDPGWMRVDTADLGSVSFPLNCSSPSPGKTGSEFPTQGGAHLDTDFNRQLKDTQSRDVCVRSLPVPTRHQ